MNIHPRYVPIIISIVQKNVFVNLFIFDNVFKVDNCAPARYSLRWSGAVCHQMLLRLFMMTDTNLPNPIPLRSLRSSSGTQYSAFATCSQAY